jgi:hypothetical protein
LISASKNRIKIVHIILSSLYDILNCSQFIYSRFSYSKLLRSNKNDQIIVQKNHTIYLKEDPKINIHNKNNPSKNYLSQKNFNKKISIENTKLNFSKLNFYLMSYFDSIYLFLKSMISLLFISIFVLCWFNLYKLLK